MDERRRRALLGWAGGSIAFPLAWFLFSHFIENQPAGPAWRAAAIVGGIWSAMMFVVMVYMPHRRRKNGR